MKKGTVPIGKVNTPEEEYSLMQAIQFTRKSVLSEVREMVEKEMLNSGNGAKHWNAALEAILTNLKKLL